MFVVNELALEDAILPAEKVAKSLLKEKIWCYSKFAFNIKKLKKGDSVLLYLAGKGYRCYYASFTLNESVDIIVNSENGDLGLPQEFYRRYQLFSPIDNIQVYDTPIVLNEELRAKLDFIIDKKYWGLFFRQGIKKLSEIDFHTITSAYKA